MGASLQFARLQDATLQGANLQYASLNGAFLQNADLRGANLTGASFGGATLTSAKGYEPSGPAIVAYAVVTDFSYNVFKYQEEANAWLGQIQAAIAGGSKPDIHPRVVELKS